MYSTPNSHIKDMDGVTVDDNFRHLMPNHVDSKKIGLD
jgi:hypothetical protein